MQRPCASEKDLQPINCLLEDPMESDINYQPSSGNPSGQALLETNLQEDYLSSIVQDSDPMGTLHWPYMPFLSQLEAFPSNYQPSKF